MLKIFNKIMQIPFDFNFKKWMFIVNNLSKVDIKKTKVGKDWLLVNCFEKISENTIANCKKIIVVGANSDKDILNFVSINPVFINRFLFIVKLLKSNHHQFGAKISYNHNVVFLQGDSVVDLHDSFHRFNLIHKSYFLSKSWFWLYYYYKSIKNITENYEYIDFTKINFFPIIFHQINFLKELIFKKFDFRLKLMKISAFLNSFFTVKLKSKKPIYELKHILITGWYGTETIGDKAILMELIHAFKENNPKVKFSITSIIPGLSNLTNKELGLNLEIHELKKINFSNLQHIDGVVFGGGPLMDSSQLKFIEVLFKWASKLGKKTIIFGSGVGPIKNKLNNILISSILKNSSTAFFRDENSAKLAGELGYKGKLLWACDPALRFVRRWSINNDKLVLSKKIVCLFREQTSEYSTNSNSITQKNIKIFNDFLSSVSSEFDAISMLPMHSFWYGKDDRDYINLIYNYKIIPKINETSLFYTLNELLFNLKTSSFGIPMRYHGHIFMAALGIPFISIDYTGKDGKVSSFIRRYGLQKMSISTIDLNKKNILLSKFDLIKKEINIIKSKMKNEVDKDLSLLLKCYKNLEIHK